MKIKERQQVAEEFGINVQLLINHYGARFVNRLLKQLIRVTMEKVIPELPVSNMLLEDADVANKNFYSFLETCGINVIREYQPLIDEESGDIVLVEQVYMHTLVPHESPDGFHKHKCGECGNVWEHGDGCFGKVKLHTCSKCGVQEWDWYEGPQHPHII